MSKEAVGTVRIDLEALAAGFVKGTNQAVASLDQLAKNVKRAEAGFRETGARLSMTLTAPIVALGIAATRAADPTNKMGKELKALAETAQKALAPIGTVLIRTYEEMRPAIYRAVEAIGQLSQSFASMDPEMQKSIIKWAALTAAIGPAMIAMSAALTLFRVGIVVTSTFMVAVKGLSGAFSGLTVALGAFTLGGEIYDSFRQVQEQLAALLTLGQAEWEKFKTAAAIALAWFESRFREMVNHLIAVSRPLTEKLSHIMLGMGATGMMGAGAFTAAGLSMQAALVSGPSFADSSSKIMAEHMAKMEELNGAYKIQMQEIAKTFQSGGNSSGNSAWAEARNLINGLLDRLGMVKISLGELPAAAVPAFGSLANAAADATGHVEAFEAKLKDLASVAQRVRDRIDPAGPLRRELAEAGEARDRGLLSASEYESEARRIGVAIDELGQKAQETFGDKLRVTVQGFAGSASDAFADMVIDGKASFSDLAKSWGKALVSMATNYFIFKPIFDAMGSMLGGAVPGSQTATAPPLGSQGIGPSFGDGGTVASRPTLFPMAGGGRGRYGERGPELGFFPLERVNGKLGIGSRGGGGTSVSVNIIDQRGSGEPVQVSESRGPDGRRQFTAVIRDTVNGMVRDGSLDRSMGQTYGLRRRGVGA